MKIASSDTFAKKLWDDPCGPALYIGNPALALFDLAFYDAELSPSEIREQHRSQSTCPYPSLTCELADIYEGTSLKKFDWRESNEWQTTLELSLKHSAHYHEFFLQGCGKAASITSEGLHIQTPSFERSNELGGIGAVNKFDSSKDLPST